jgi:hypothetical protein
MITILTTAVTLSAAELKHENSRETLMGFIMDLDFEVAEADFTESLILKLATALAADSRTSTMITIGNKIAAMQGYTP